ncbi:MAG: HEPN domain-containing protein [Candidatus Omnitrophica bacterium]|nr:HEPN domain-containing protein [Candidatus Omnitrophota bacterium]MBU4303044.1 HEPN domain-containing protein [Candidatus Omnitrophota bacterium]MBU4468176.1 HEPN domain-containing protein [Candidatus Omnitrophota bacterium]MCG2707371.1 HEPN domain-containing protein [Candidatus Omnitrophota bacterium]
MKDYDLKEALEKKKIISFPAGPSLISKELEAAKEDLLDAKDLFSRERFKSATTLAYYTIFHTTRALLYKKGYREKSHIQLGFAIKAFYVDKGLLPQEYYNNFIQALDFRELADYKSKFSKETAERNIQAGEEAIRSTGNILKNKKL